MDLLIIIYIALALTLINTIALVVILFNQQNKNIPGTRTFLWIILCLTIVFVKDFMTSNWHYQQFLNFHYLIYPIKQTAFILGPLTYQYTKQTLGFYSKGQRINLLNYIPFVLVFLFTTYQALSTKPFNMWYGHFDGLITAIMRLGTIFYTLLSIAVLKNNGYYFPLISKQTNPKINNFIAPFLLFMLGYWVLKFALSIKFINFDNTDIFFEVWIYFVIHVSIALIISLLLYYLIQKPDLLLTVNKKIANFIENKDYSDYLKRLAFKLEVDKVYKDPDITLSSLSESLNINPRYLSTLINSNYNIGFTELINNHRLNESKTLLLNKKELTIQEIMYDVGFNSKSVFYSNFKKLTGVTPKEFREKFQVLEN